MEVPPNTPSPDDEYYAKLTKGKKVKVVNIPGKGKAMIAVKDVEEGGIIVEDHALVCTQDASDRVAGIPCCAHTLASFETPEGVFKRLRKKHDVPNMPELEAYQKAEGRTPCPCEFAKQGCPMSFVNPKIREKADKEWHYKLCKGRMTPSQAEAYDYLENKSWKQGGVDYSDSFHLTLHAIARIIAGSRNSSVKEAWYPYDILAWAPWDELAVVWTLKKKKTTPTTIVNNYLECLYNVFGKTDCEFIGLDFKRLSRLLGAIQLNAQERSPESPFGRYLVWLEEEQIPNGLLGNKFDWRSSEPTDISNKLYYSSRGQGVYRVHSVTNHSCNPNAEVAYTENMDEGIYMLAKRPIKAGDEVTISYVDEVENEPREKRQKYLLRNYRFSCTCLRCENEK
eukprot:TRINITY_DN10421_c0_g1_i1.p1 TRINITY_DN10421_c0_g1~~TRINITY_DN10421_c0_g1_i1.p1  ORF type:complete len:421 (+),score=57.54 TRINITY_DN10421_c0_g1_i1:78-1265(+)